MPKEDRKSQLEAYVTSREFREVQARDPHFEKRNQKLLKANLWISGLAVGIALILALSFPPEQLDIRFFSYVVIALVVLQMPTFILGALLAIIPFDQQPYEKRVTRIIHLLSLLVGLGFLIGMIIFSIQLWRQ